MLEATVAVSALDKNQQQHLGVTTMLQFIAVTMALPVFRANLISKTAYM